MTYNKLQLELYIQDKLGKNYEKFRFKVDRLITLYLEYDKIRVWLDDNKHFIGSKMYKENVTVLNGLMQNIRNLEDDVSLFEVADSEGDDNPLLSNLNGLKKRDTNVGT